MAATRCPNSRSTRRRSTASTITTDRGAIVMDLDPQLAPNTVNNFVGLARQGYYDGLTFHRVVPEFVIQGGCPEGSGRGGPGYKFADEPVQGRVHARRGRDGERRSRHQRLAVLHLHRRLHAQAHAELQPVRLRGRGHRRRAGDQGRRRDAARSRSKSATAIPAELESARPAASIEAVAACGSRGRHVPKNSASIDDADHEDHDHRLVDADVVGVAGARC